MKKLIVVVEDDENFSTILKRFHLEVPKLMGGDSELIALQSLGMLKHLLAVSQPQLVILDLTMPDSAQPDTIEYIGRERHSMPPIFAISGDERLSVRDECIAKGAVGFAIKKHIVESPNFFFAEVYNEYQKFLCHGARL